MLKSYYEILDVAQDATEQQIRKAYRKKIRDFHPDLNPEKAKAHRRSRELNIALEVLTNPDKRKRYDEKLRRMGKAEANAEFEQPRQSSTGNDDFQPEFEVDTRGKNSGSRKRPPHTSKLKPVWLAASVITAGVSAVCVAILLLWIVLRIDPTGLIAAESEQVQPVNIYEEDENESTSANEIASLRSEIAALKQEIAGLSDSHSKRVENLGNQLVAVQSRLEAEIAESTTEQPAVIDDVHSSPAFTKVDLLLDHRPEQSQSADDDHVVVLIVETTWTELFETYEWFDFQIATSSHTNGVRIHRDMITSEDAIEVAKYGDRYVVFRVGDFGTNELTIRSGGVEVVRVQLRGIGSNSEYIAKLQEELEDESWIIEWMDSSPRATRQVDFDSSLSEDDRSGVIFKYLPRQVALEPVLRLGNEAYVYDEQTSSWLGAWKSPDRRRMRPMKLRKPSGQ